MERRGLFGRRDQLEPPGVIDRDDLYRVTARDSEPLCPEDCRPRSGAENRCSADQSSSVCRQTRTHRRQGHARYSDVAHLHPSGRSLLSSLHRAHESLDEPVVVTLSIDEPCFAAERLTSRAATQEPSAVRATHTLVYVVLQIAPATPHASRRGVVWKMLLTTRTRPPRQLA